MALCSLSPTFSPNPSAPPSSLSISPSRTAKITQKNSKFRPKCPPISALSDPYVLQIAENLEDSLPSTSSPPLEKLRNTSSDTLLSTQWPSRKDEPFRFTDTSLIKNSRIEPIQPPNTEKVQSLNSLNESLDTLLPTVVIVDGYVVESLCNLDELMDFPSGVYVGSLLSVDSESLRKRVSEYEFSFKGDLFWSLNGVGTPDVVLVYVPEGCKVEKPLHLRYVSVEGSDKEVKALPFSNPRVLVLVEKGGEISIVEEYVGGDRDKCYWTNSVMEVVVGEGAKVSHSYIQNQSFNAAHIKWTWVQQESTSKYEHVEVSTGGKLSRHNIHIQQVGPDTVTELSTFHMCVSDQTQDLHSRLVLDHPRGVSQQIHKCIVAHSSGQAVFDGNVQVNRYAQQTDAGQLTRSLLLEPRATVNVKPNLQIIADDVKCSHGAAISDLEEDQLFYFKARGIDTETARKALIFSFAAEVVERFPNASVRKKVETHIRQLLDPSHPSP
ncbi:Protein ABCI7, chloroplastic [Capsicum chinense]|uniref:Protein ABCI7, chloroplastic n=1 Tax=Capsicum annuum TaxID=4072 RepID=A0A2G3APL6_CAPAN|nr:protein ABCI7, chloroplastic [Capsicum annuum]KAF3644917.1 Protein ABCI7, chloroplastic [Capsicum annuum]KAF3649576.1 Protein ABCI7, chloroplastic [Capsicum annuum]PHT96150.1 Protein ABCI7, chloroplastic [Capsicum annuum]PHU08399.1 Protein ABCI7, chloroplastic [Capsicum chinense]